MNFIRFIDKFDRQQNKKQKQKQKMYGNITQQQEMSFDNISIYLYNESQQISSFSQLSKDQGRNNELMRSSYNLIHQKMSQQSNINDHSGDNSNEYFDTSKQDEQQESIIEIEQNKRSNKKTKRHSKKKLAKQNKYYAKNYREKRKQKFKMLEEENSFLKFKVNDLTFRLKQAEFELNKFKYSNQANNMIPNLQSTRESLLKQIAEIIEKQDQQQIDKLVQLQEQLKQLDKFDGKHKIDLLNYFMSELLENLLNDMSFYYIDSLAEEKGRWKAGWTQAQDRRIDYEICQMHGGATNFEEIKKLLYSLPQFSLDHLRNFKSMWKKLYHDYLNIVKQGNLIELLCRPLFQGLDKEKHQRRMVGSLKLQLYFQKIKYRQDMRQLRQSWFHELKYQSSSNNYLR